MCKYLILGNGFLGNRLYNYFRDNREDVILSNERIGSITTSKEIKFLITKHQPEIVINAIGKTGRPTVDWCELNKESTFFSNVTIPTFIAEVCNDTDIRMVHLGSGCIYEGDNEGKGYSEDDEPNFRESFYSRTKVYSEQILSRYKDVLQLRIRMPIDNKPSDRNLITKLVKYREVIGDIENSITIIDTLLETAKKLIDMRKAGVYNVINGEITHRRILELYKEIVDPEYEMPRFIGVDELKKLTMAGRSNCVLSIEKLKNDGIEVENINEAMRRCLAEYRKYIMK